MQKENLDIDDITNERRKGIEETIRPISIEELKAIGEEIFPFLDHPWRETFFNFLAENKGSTFHHATTNDSIQIIYCHAKDKGMWFIPRRGMGTLQVRGLGILKEIVEGKH